MNKNHLKQVVLTICIGAAINIVTVLAQYFIEWLQTIPAEVPGTIVGVAKYLAWSSKNLS